VRRWIVLTPSGELPDAPAVGDWDPDAREALAHLYRLLDRLTAEDRSLFITRYVEKLEIAEIASVHGLTLATAKRRVARVTRRMGTRIGRDPALAGYLDGPWKRKGASAG